MRSVETHKKNVHIYSEEDETHRFVRLQADRQIRITFEGFGSGKDGCGFDSLVAFLKRAGVERDEEDSLNDTFIDDEGFRYVIDGEALSLLKKNGSVMIDAQP